MLAILFAILLGQATPEQSARAQPSPVTDVRALEPSQPRILAEVDTAAAQGDPIGLSCKADGTIYLRVVRGKDKTRHYLIATRPAISVGQSDGLPAWAADYWAWKSALIAPAMPLLKIDVERRKEAARSVNTADGGELSGMSSAALASDGGEGVSGSVVMAAANNTVINGVITLRFKGQVIGEWTNEVPQLGMRFGWAPAPMGMLAYVNADGRLFVLDREGHQAQVPGIAHALLPAWSPDGKRILCLQKTKSTLYLLTEVRFE